MSNINFVVLDFETATASRASVCEVGLCFVRDGQIMSSPSYLMRPPFNRYDAVNTTVHGITPQMTEDAPEFWLQWPAIAAVLEGETVVAHYAPFDMGVINDECQRCGLPLPEFRFVCSCALSRFVVPELESHALEPLCAHFGISTDGHHRAGSDALMTAKLMLCLCEAAGVDSIDALVEKYRYRFGSFHEGTYTPFHRIPDYTGKTNLDHFAKEYQADADGFDELSPFYGKEVVFTGTMNSPRQELMRLVMDIGGRTKDSLTRTADFLVVGQQDYRVVGEDGMSSKQKKALAMIEKGAPLTVLSEEEFLKMISGSHGFGQTDFLDLPHDEIERLGKLFPSLTVLDFEKMKGILY